MSAPVSRRWQAQPQTAACTTCGKVIATGQDAQRWAVAHVLNTGHEVRVTDTRLIIITPRAVARV